MAGRAAALATVSARGAAGWQPGRADHRGGLRHRQPHAADTSPRLLRGLHRAASRTAPPARYGWQRIAAQERENFDWRSEPLALEYWHFERRDGLTWYDAMRLVYDTKTLERLFSTEQLLAAGVREETIPRLGLPWAPAAVVVRGEDWRRPR